MAGIITVQNSQMASENPTGQGRQRGGDGVAKFETCRNGCEATAVASLPSGLVHPLTLLLLTFPLFTAPYLLYPIFCASGA
jgi:hypothetical protein